MTPMILALAAAAAIVSGQYEDLLVAVAPDGQVEARLFEARGDGPAFSCEILFSGRRTQNGSVIGISWTRGATPHRAELRARGTGVTLLAPASSGYPGCGMTMGAELDAPLDRERSALGRWTQLLHIVPSRAVLRPAPNPTAASHPYLVAGDVVGLLSRRPDWVEVAFVSDSGRTTTGWLPARETASITPP